MTEPRHKTGAIPTVTRKLIGVAITAALVASAGCVPKDRDPLQIVIAVDTSASIARPSEEQAFDSIQLSMRSFGRRDSVVVVPITGDAWNDSQRNIIRDGLSEAREPYDEDLRRFAARIRKALEAMRADALKEPAGPPTSLAP